MPDSILKSLVFALVGVLSIIYAVPLAKSIARYWSSPPEVFSRQVLIVRVVGFFFVLLAALALVGRR